MVTLLPQAEINSASKSLVLIHAFPLSSEMYKGVASEIHTLLPDYNIILVDLPGFGSSPVRENWTLSEAMQELHHKLNVVGITNPVIGGTSMGGYAALAYYRLYMNEVAALILSNTKAEADTEEAKASREEFAKDVEARGYEAVYMRMLNKLTARSTVQKHPETLDTLRTMISVASPAAIAAALRAMALREDSLELLHKITTPTLVITGSGDELIPPAISKAMSDTIPNAKFVELQNVGHLTPLEAPKQWAEQIATLLQN
jgi:non-heme chloroperoxidase